MLSHTMTRKTKQSSATISGSKGSRAPEPRLSSSERAYREIKEAILSGSLQPESRLVELSLAAEFGVSRTPIREALKRLIAENLVAIDPVRGTVVKGIDQREVEEVYAIREVLDGLAARLAARRIMDGDLSRLKSLMKIMESAVEEKRQNVLVQANVRFHEMIYQASGNDRLVALGQSITDFVRRFSATAFRSYERDVEVLDEHRALIDALERRDPDAAESAAREHMVKARSFLAHMSVVADFPGEDLAVRD
jgi:DNA-binding GntR family transcriptional regulator